VFLALVGLFSGLLGGLLGVGGGTIVVPILIIVFGLESRVAVGTSLVMILFTALSGTIAYFRQKRIDWPVGLLASVATVPGAAIGAYLTNFFSSRVLAIIFGLMLFLMAALMIRRSGRVIEKQNDRIMRNTESEPKRWKRRIVDGTGKVFNYDARLIPNLPLFFFGGLASGFLGIGGGLIVVPILADGVGLPMHLAVATSLLTMIFTSLSGASTHVMLGDVRFDYAVPLIIGILLGAQAGARTARRLKSATLERVFALFVIAIGIILIASRL
jgi:uncharacterized membrane protein YfcA